MSLRFHWRLSVWGGRSGIASAANYSPQQCLRHLENDVNFCHRAEEIGIESLLIPFNYYRVDPLILSTALGMATKKLKFLVAYRPGLISPTLFVQQINTLSALTNGRVSLNIIIGHSTQEQGYYGDFLDTDRRYSRAKEFLQICHALWSQEENFNFQGNYYQIENGQLGTPFIAPEGDRPEIYISGASTLAVKLTGQLGDCGLFLWSHPDKVRSRIQTLKKQGKEVGLRGSIIVRPTRKEAIEATYSLIESSNNLFVQEIFKTSDMELVKSAQKKNDIDPHAEENWLTPWLWKGAIPYCGPSSIALVGNPTDIASAIIEYKKIGCSQFILSGSPELETMNYFNQEVLPLIQEMEKDIG
ncbi:LLM class flavin-dependent oxidoreductase [Spirulina sp. 06S082]|uniref:LLM class flavin-dependent oxidoreductase n=1 Tax=Spirulina sp. 06S082 TaxID=3110248 RepID=UPI002B22069A|nr:LLM class flavin-dependent oxidoreductase [Spirulina sp. 06S082]MEA5472538.1 LLM class flavin-dependent oxidoreductase [Spirulina sp. 06S082]